MFVKSGQPQDVPFWRDAEIDGGTKVTQFTRHQSDMYTDYAAAPRGHRAFDFGRKAKLDQLKRVNRFEAHLAAELWARPSRPAYSL